MWAVLRCARRHGESDPWLCGPMVRTANILARRGFLKIQRQPKRFYSTQLTNAGTEALLIDSGRSRSEDDTE
jgi:hypothetical protein